MSVAFDSVIPAAAPRAPAAAWPTTLAGERVELHAERALYWPAGATLFVADVHLGKAAAFRAGGIALPRGGTQADLARLAALLARTRARRLVVLGDFLHAAAGRVAALDAAFVAWRAAARERRADARARQPRRPRRRPARRLGRGRRRRAASAGAVPRVPRAG